MRLSKYRDNPILSPNPANTWESLVTTNPGAYYKDGAFYLLYRAAGHDSEHRIHFGLATSHDGFHFTRVSNSPVLSPSDNGPDSGCIEDARIVEFDNTYFITYAYRPYPPGLYWTMEPDQVRLEDVSSDAPAVLRNNITNTGLLISTDLKSFRRVGRMTQPTQDDRDVILFPDKIGNKYYMLHRPKGWVGEAYGCTGPSIWIASSDDLLEWSNHQLLMKGEMKWEGNKIGGSPPPLRTKCGWLLLYHGVDASGFYRVGVAMLDVNHPETVIARAPDFILEPEHEYELNGLYNGCVFPVGNVIVDETLYVYYGAADVHCCVATCNVNELVDYVMSYPVLHGTNVQE